MIVPRIRLILLAAAVMLTAGIMAAWRSDATGLAVLNRTLDGLLAQDGGRARKMSRLLNALVRAGHPVRVIYTTGHWLDIDSLEDVVNAGAF